MLSRGSALNPGWCGKLFLPRPASEAQPQCSFIMELLERGAQGEEGLQARGLPM